MIISLENASLPALHEERIKTSTYVIHDDLKSHIINLLNVKWKKSFPYKVCPSSTHALVSSYCLWVK